MGEPPSTHPHRTRKTVGAAPWLVFSWIAATVSKLTPGKIVAFESYEPNATDYTGAILTLRAANHEIVHLQGNAGDSPQAVAQLRQLGLKVPITSYTPPTIHSWWRRSALRPTV